MIPNTLQKAGLVRFQLRLREVKTLARSSIKAGVANEVAVSTKIAQAIISTAEARSPRTAKRTLPVIIAGISKMNATITPRTIANEVTKARAMSRSICPLEASQT